jgi:hypothetical protein
MFSVLRLWGAEQVWSTARRAKRWFGGVLVPESPDPSVITDDSLTDTLSDSDEEDGDDPTVMPCRGSHPNLEERKDDDEEEDGEDQVEGDNSCSEKEGQESSSERRSGEHGEKGAF